MWDENKCGSLQLAELRVALAKCVSEATAFNNKPDPAQEHIRKLQRRAQMADDAAQATEAADKAELALAEYRERLKTRADVRLGALLQKRMIKPGEVVVHWAKSKGEHAGELSKVQFRRAVLKLFEGRARRSPRGRGGRGGGGALGLGYDPSSGGEGEGVDGAPDVQQQQQQQQQQAGASLQAGDTGSAPESPGGDDAEGGGGGSGSGSGGTPHTSAAEIDAIFDEYDEDKGGYMDKDEAAAMIKGLRQVGLESEQEQRNLERDARVARAKATKKAAAAMAEVSTEVTDGAQLPDPASLPAPGAGGSSSTPGGLEDLAA